MERYLGKSLFSVDLKKESESPPTAAYGLLTAEEAGFKEDWLQQAIAKEPELVIGPCREAGLADEGEDWLFWKREVNIPGVGTIDLLLISEDGRVAIVETKLSYNAQGRRSVVAQLLDYAVNLTEIDPAALPDPPGGNREQVEDHIRRGDFLLIVAGDQLDPRAVRFARKLFGEHIVNEWALALVELAVFAKQDSASGPKHLLVPHVCGLVIPEKRQVVKVIVEGAPGVRVEVERVRTNGSPRQEWDEERYFTSIADSAAPILALAEKLRDSSSPAAVYGSGKNGCIGLAFNGKATINLYVDGRLAAKPLTVLQRAVGSGPAQVLSQGLANLFGDQYGDSWKMVPAAQTMAHVSDLLGLIDRLVAEVKRQH